MYKTKILILLAGITLLLPASILSQPLMVKPKAAKTTIPAQIAIAPVNVSIQNIHDSSNRSMLRIKCKTKIKWSIIPSQYANVWLQVCKSDKSSCGGAISVKNSGIYGEFRADTSMVEKDWVIKLYTNDKKYTGYSNKFTVNGMLQQCCPDGNLIEPNCK